MDNHISLRDYFAARAPLEIPSWFRLHRAEKKPAMPSARRELTSEQLDQWQGLGDYLEDDDVDPEVLEFRDRYDAASHAVGAWEEAYERDRYLAWRWAYADLMIAAREEGGQP